MYKKVYIQDNEIKFDYLSEPINFNKMPEPFEEVSQEEYFKGLDMWACDYYGYFQLFGENARKIFGELGVASVYCDFNNDEGWARAKLNRTGEYKFFRIGCKHDYELIASDSLTNTYKCKKCGNVIEVSNGR